MDTEKLNETPVVITDKNLKSEESKKRDEETNQALFNSLIVQIGNDGKFQTRINYLYNLVFVMFITLPYCHYILLLAVPTHWCYVPGRDLTNYTQEEWKAKWIPKQTGLESGKEEFESCKMYSFNSTDGTNVTDCKYGWDYDRQWFTQTIPSQENWVCDRALYATNAYTAGSVGDIIGTFILGQLGDLYGRRPVFYLCIAILIISRLLLVFTAHIYAVFALLVAIGSGFTTSVFQSPLIISMEVSPDSRKDHIAFIQCIGWVIGMGLLSMIGWIMKDWTLIVLVTTFPCAIFFFLYKFMPESPRWLASKGRMYEAMQVLQHIAKVNGTSLPDNTLDVLQKIANKKEKFRGAATLFTHWRLAKNALIITTIFVVNSLCYYSILLNATNLAGNPFINIFWQSLAEIPGYIIARILGNFLGRRWALSGAYVLITTSSLVFVSVYHLHIFAVQRTVLAIINMSLTVTGYMGWLQSLGIFPTCVRQTGISSCATVSSIFGILGPYIVYLGTKFDARLPYVVVLCLAAVGAIASTFLPETLDQKLPETLEDAYVFGKDQKFWSFPIYKIKEKVSTTKKFWSFATFKKKKEKDPSKKLLSFYPKKLSKNAVA